VNKQIYPDMQASSQRASDMFDSIYRLRFFNKIALPMIMLLILVIFLNFFLNRSKFGIQLKMTGAARKAAKFSGINVERIIGSAFVICALTATLGGLTVTSLSRVGAWYNGTGYDFKAVTAIVIGGMTLAGGRGSIIGVLGGVLIIGLMNNIMTLLGIGTFSQDMIRGAIFIIVVGINAKSLRSLGRDDA
jgi:ribose/xylose/arabinose/galactoside ABC-type transport system permease subunit